MTRVALEKVSKRFNAGVGRVIQAVQELDLVVEGGELLSLVGPSGCGKSTILRLIAGLEQLSQGAVYLDGVRVNSTPPQERDVAMVFQNHPLYPHLTAYENMALTLKLRKFQGAS